MTASSHRAPDRATHGGLHSVAATGAHSAVEPGATQPAAATGMGGRRRAVDAHPPKVETFDLLTNTNTDPKGIVRMVDTYRVEEFGLYMARPMVNRPNIDYLESWLLPGLGARVTDWHFAPGHERDQDFYIDIAEIEPGPTAWRATDLYLDIVVRTGRDLEVLDIDELLAALGAGLIDFGAAEGALHRAYDLVDKIASHRYDLDRFLV